MEKAKELIGDCRVHADNVMKNCGEPGGIELQKQLEDLVQLADDVNDMVRERGDELRKVYRHADQFTQLLDVSLRVSVYYSIRVYIIMHIIIHVSYAAGSSSTI